MSDNEKQLLTEEKLKQSIMNMAIEYWRVRRVFERMLTKVEAGEQSRYKNQFRWFIKKMNESLEEVDMNIVNVEGQSFDPGMAATPLNIDEFDESDQLIVEQMIEPIIMGQEGLLKTGTVILRKV